VPLPETVPQLEPERIRIQPELLAKNAVAVKVEAAKRRQTQGEFLDWLIERFLNEPISQE